PPTSPLFPYTTLFRSYYSDIIFNPYYTQLLGWALASMFIDSGADVVMTTEVKGIPIALYVAQGLGLPLAVCRFRNRPSDGPAVADRKSTRLNSSHVKI